MRLAIAQYAIPKTPEAAIDLVLGYREKLRDCDLLVLPEIGLGRWLEADSETGDETQKNLVEHLASTLSIAVCLSIREERANRWVFATNEGQISQEYDKIHLFSPLGEAKHYDAGTCVSVKSQELANESWNVAAAVCYDLRFAELFAALRARQPDLCIIPARWPTARKDHFTTLLRARALETQSFVIGCNACGDDPHKDKLEYAGHSIAIDPYGRILAEAGASEELLIVDLRKSIVQEERERLPVWDDRVLA